MLLGEGHNGKKWREEIDRRDGWRRKATSNDSHAPGEMLAAREMFLGNGPAGDRKRCWGREG